MVFLSYLFNLLVDFLRVESLQFRIVILEQKRKSSLVEIANVVDQLAVHLHLEVLPSELGVLVFGSDRKQVESPGEDWYLRDVDHIGSEHSGSVSLGELDALVIQVLSRGNLVQQSPFLIGSYQRAGKHDSVEGDIVFSHELDQRNLLRILPPVSPLVCIIRCD